MSWLKNFHSKRGQFLYPVPGTNTNTWCLGKLRKYGGKKLEIYKLTLLR
jgi:hypothetical protein